VIVDPGGTDIPLCSWEYAGSTYRLSLVGGLMRFEQEVRGGWYLIEPDHDTTAMMVCAEQLSTRLQHAEAALIHQERR
jgi:hypothetical protein